MAPNSDSKALKTTMYKPGEEVETTMVVAALEEDRIRAYYSNGKEYPPHKGMGREFLGVDIGSKAIVLEQIESFVRLELLGGRRKSQKVWMGIDAVRRLPTEIESVDDVVDGLSLLARRLLYAEAHTAGMNATNEAEARYPFSGMPTEAKVIADYLENRRLLYESTKAAERQSLLDRHAIDASHLKRIEAEGDEKRWPVWDGLSDKAGDIPSFGPARTDGRGRIVMGEREKAERRDATIRTLSVLKHITDETDSDEVWGNLSPRFGGAH